MVKPDTEAMPASMIFLMNSDLLCSFFDTSSKSFAVSVSTRKETSGDFFFPYFLSSRLGRPLEKGFVVFICCLFCLCLSCLT